MRKGQAAMEFLMTYGWAILVVLAAIGALAYFGVLSPDRFLPDKCVANPPFSCTEYSVSEANDVRLGLTNNAGVDLAEVHVTIETPDGTCGTYSNTSVTSNGAMVGDQLVTFPQGAATECTSLVTGDRFRADLTIVYRKAGESVNHTSTGSVQARVEA